MVIAPANTGKLKSSKKAVINKDHPNRGIRFIDIPLLRIFNNVTIKLIAPPIEDMPAKCKETIPISTDAPECARTELSGGYSVQPVPIPASIKLDKINKKKAGGNNQNEKLFKRGKAMSTAPHIIGKNQLP